jgi:voltage-gated potassium channel
VLLGFGWLDALYQTVTTVATVGFREVEPFGTAEKLFTIPFIVFGVGSALYTLVGVLETLVSGRLTDRFRRRRMQHRIDQMSGHVVVCGWGRVGQTVAGFVSGRGEEVVVVDRDAGRIAGISHPTVLGEATQDAVLLRAGVNRARVLIAALTSDADNLFVTLSGRALQPSLFVVARARAAEAESKLRQAGADRVVNPQQIGGARMAAFATQPVVAEFLDVVMHDGSLEFRLEEVAVSAGSSLVELSLGEAQLSDRTGALVLALRGEGGEFVTNPPPETVLSAGQVMVVIGTSAQLAALVAVAVAR